MRVLLFSIAASAVLIAAPAANQVRLTSSANVTLRRLPKADAPAVGQVPLGTELVDVGPPGLDKTWLHVRLPDSREGWITAALTRSAVPSERWRVVLSIGRDRVARQGDGFAALAELTDFLERESDQPDTGIRAQIEVLHMQALSKAAAAIPIRRDHLEPFSSWIAGHQSLVVYDEPGGHWMVAPKAIWDRHDALATTPSADALAWMAVTNGLPGECAGQAACYLAALNQLEGEYLRKHPLGPHALEAVTSIADTTDRLTDASKPHETIQFDRAADCSSLTASIDALRSTVSVTNVPNRDAAIQGLSAMRSWCK